MLQQDVNYLLPYTSVEEATAAWVRGMGRLTYPLHWCFYTPTSEYRKKASVEINNIESKDCSRKSGLQTHQHSWICNTCISTLHVSVTFSPPSPPVRFMDAVESLHFLLVPFSLSLLHEALFINQPRPNYTPLAPTPPPYRGSGGPKNTDADWR